MWPIALVLLVVTNVLAVDEEEPFFYWFGAALDLEVYEYHNICIATIKQTVINFAHEADRSIQALALAQLIALFGSLPYGDPGDSCAEAYLSDHPPAVVPCFLGSVIDSIVNRKSDISAVSEYIQSLNSAIDSMVQLVPDRDSLLDSTGPRGNCSGGGRTYQFEAAWDLIRNNAPTELVNKEYEVVEYMYMTEDIPSNNIAAAITAASLPDLVRVFEKAFDAVLSFVKSISTKDIVLVTDAAKAAKEALIQAAVN